MEIWRYMYLTPYQSLLLKISSNSIGFKALILYKDVILPV